MSKMSSARVFPFLILSYRKLQFCVESDTLDYNKEVSNTTFNIIIPLSE
jgi:hypothetical protein